MQPHRSGGADSSRPLAASPEAEVFSRVGLFLCVCGFFVVLFDEVDFGSWQFFTKKRVVCAESSVCDDAAESDYVGSGDGSVDYDDEDDVDKTGAEPSTSRSTDEMMVLLTSLSLSVERIAADVKDLSAKVNKVLCPVGSPARKRVAASIPVGHQPPVFPFFGRVTRTERKK